jgi:hypothetical protein
MDDEDLVDVEIAHEAPDDISDAYTSEASEFPFHRLTVVANRLSAGQPDTELRSLSSVDEEQVKLL